jgi:cytochrome c biogenesis protein CcmG, thiol:disulfide interchange protein DsbE
MTEATFMMKRTTGLAAIVAVAALTAGTSRVFGLGVEHRPAPEVRLRDVAGKTVSLSDLRGKVVIVDFWASWCPSCRQSFPALAELGRLYASRGLEVIAVNVDQQRRDADAFLAGQPAGLKVVFDQQGAAPRAFDVQAMPSSFVIGRDGTIRFTHVGFNDRTLEAYRREIGQLLDEPAGGDRP